MGCVIHILYRSSDERRIHYIYTIKTHNSVEDNNIIIQLLCLVILLLLLLPNPLNQKKDSQCESPSENRPNNHCIEVRPMREHFQVDDYHQLGETTIDVPASIHDRHAYVHICDYYAIPSILLWRVSTILIFLVFARKMFAMSFYITLRIRQG